MKIKQRGDFLDIDETACEIRLKRNNISRDCFTLNNMNHYKTLSLWWSFTTCGDCGLKKS